MFLFFVIALLSLSYLWLRHRYSYWERRGVKGPQPVYLFGNLLKQLTFREHISNAYQRWSTTYNDVPYIGFYKLLQPAVMIRDPELQREVLVKAFMNFHTNDVSISDEDELLKANPFFSTGEEWRQSRALFGTFFSANKIRSVFPAMLQVGKEWEQYCRSLGSDAEIDVKDVCRRFTTETMLRCTFSIDGKSFAEQSEFLDMGSVFNPDAITAMKIMVTFFVPVVQKLLKISVVPKLMAKRFTELVRGQIEIRDAGSAKCEDVLQFVLNGREKYEMTQTQIAGICLSFFVEAYETSSNVLSSALYQLAKHPHIQDELARCIQESLAANNNEITYDLINKHQYLEKVAFECMRIHPIFFGIQKLCTKAYTMPLLPGQTEPVTIPVGTPVLVPFATVQQDPVNFPDPDIFDPERFSPEQKTLRHKSAFMPFSDGPRMCIGMHLAMFNFKMGLFQMIRSFDIKLHPNNKPFELHPMSFFNIPQDGFKLIFTPRKTVLAYFGRNDAGICLSFFVEAYETSSALYQLAKHPHTQDELARCIQESLAANNNEITYDLINKHQYLEKVAFECMRIRPIFFGIQKLCTKAYTMPLLPGQTEPVTIPVGTPVLVPFATVQQDPVNFPDPDIFDPERFSPEQKTLRHKSAFMPFSDGPRMCIGMHLAMFNFKMGLFQMIRSFDIKLHPNNKPFELHPMSFFNIPQDGFKLIFTPRKTV